jgi:peptidoglycan/LPS O-acetylase OafA/YrhL
MSIGAQKTSVGYIPAIDGLRTIAVLSVLLFHLKAAFLPGGFVGVDIFFVISGFVVTASLMDRQFGGLKELILFFYARRLVRIMPALLVMLLTTMLLSNFFVPSSWLSGFSDDVGKSAYIGVSNITLALRSDSYFAPADAFDPYLHTWSLGVEEQFYLIFPFLIFWHQTRQKAQDFDRGAVILIAMISLASFCLSGWLSGDLQRYAFFLMPPRFWELGIGMALCLSVKRWRPWLQGAASGAISGFAALAIGGIAIAFAIPEGDHFPFPLALLPTAATAMLIMLVIARSDGWTARLLSHPVMVALGKRSYSIYLWHWPIFVLMRWTTGLHTPILMGIGATIALIVGCLSYQYIEQPTRRHQLVRTLPRGRLVAASLAMVLACTAVGFGMVRFKGKMSLSETSHFALWYADQYKKLSPALSKCGIARTDQFGDAGHIALFVPENCQMHSEGGQLIAIGDSHAVVYDPLLRQYAAATGRHVSLMYNGGCSFLPLNIAMADNPRCADATKASTAALDKTLKAGDILFLPSLRLQRIEDQWDDRPLKNVPLAPPLDRRKAVKEAVDLLSAWDRRGVRIVFEAPTPLFRAPPFRCADWFNRTNPICTPGLTIPQQEIIVRRNPVVEAMHAVVSQLSRVTIWDPLPILCPRPTCSAFEGEKPLFFDADHLSGYGNDVLYPGFIRHMKDLDKSSPNQSRSAMHPVSNRAVLPLTRDATGSQRTS